MNIVCATSKMFDRLIEIWESAVRATHHFLPEEKIVFYRKEIREKYFDAVEELDVLWENDEIQGFVGVTRPKNIGPKSEPAKIEMLFVDAACHGRGFGRKLLEHVTAKYHPVEVDVNQQNPGGLTFYRHCGFQIVGRSERDGLGDPFPLLHLSNDDSIRIRPEEPRDFEAVKKILLQAFEGHPYSNQMEYHLVELLREQSGLTLGLVAETASSTEAEQTVLGHVAFSPVLIGGNDIGCLGVGPLAVLPEKQKQGIGKRLLWAGLETLESRGYSGCVLVGDPAYYTRFGFRTDSSLTVEGIPAENVLFLSFTGSMPAGNVVFHPAFESCSH